MANNRLYIGDRSDETYCMIAKSFGDRWQIKKPQRLITFLEDSFDAASFYLDSTTELFLFDENHPECENIIKNWQKIT